MSGSFRKAASFECKLQRRQMQGYTQRINPIHKGGHIWSSGFEKDLVAVADKQYIATAERANPVHHHVNRQMTRGNMETALCCCIWCSLLQNTKLTMSVNGAATFVSQVAGLPLQILVLLCWFRAQWQDLAKLIAPEEMGRIIRRHQLPLLWCLEMGIWGIFYYLGTKGELEKNDLV